MGSGNEVTGSRKISKEMTLLEEGLANRPLEKCLPAQSIRLCWPWRPWDSVTVTVSITGIGSCGLTAIFLG